MRFPVMRCTFHDPGHSRPSEHAAEIAFEPVAVQAAGRDDLAHHRSPSARPPGVGVGVGVSVSITAPMKAAAASALIALP